MTSDVIEVSYTGDLLAHRRCPRAWAYEKYAGFHPYERVQAMEGRLVHHAMEWMTRRYAETRKHPSVDELRAQLEKYFRVLWARGIRTAFATKKETLDRVADHLFPHGGMHKTVKAAIEGAQHTEYELRAVRKLVKGEFSGKRRLLLTGVLDLVVQQDNPLSYARTWHWTDVSKLSGTVSSAPTTANSGDLEIWDYKATRSDSQYLNDYVRQLLTYAALYEERTGKVPVRCVLFFVNESKPDKQLLAVPVDEKIVKNAVDWTIGQVRLLRDTVLRFESNPIGVEGGDLVLRGQPVGKRTTDELRQQCTACGLRFDCTEYRGYLGSPNHPDIRLDNIQKN
jgi:hypothetical protein